MLLMLLFVVHEGVRCQTDSSVFVPMGSGYQPGGATTTGEYNAAYLKKHFPKGGVRQVECVYRQ